MQSPATTTFMPSSGRTAAVTSCARRPDRFGSSSKPAGGPLSGGQILPDASGPLVARMSGTQRRRPQTTPLQGNNSWAACDLPSGISLEQFTTVANFTTGGRGAADGCGVMLAFPAARPPAQSALDGGNWVDFADFRCVSRPFLVDFMVESGFRSRKALPRPCWLRPSPWRPS